MYKNAEFRLPERLMTKLDRKRQNLFVHTLNNNGGPLKMMVENIQYKSMQQE